MYDSTANTFWQVPHNTRYCNVSDLSSLILQKEKDILEIDSMEQRLQPHTAPATHRQTRRIGIAEQHNAAAGCFDPNLVGLFLRSIRIRSMQ